MGRIPKVCRDHPRESAMLMAVVVVLTAIGGIWSLVFPNPLFTSLLFAIGHIELLRLWTDVGDAPSKAEQYLTLVFLLIGIVVVIIVYPYFKSKFAPIYADIDIEFVGGSGQSFEDPDTYRLFGVARIANIGNAEVTIFEVRGETEWGTLHHSYPKQAREVLRDQFNLPDLFDGVKLSKRGTLGATGKCRFAFEQQVSGIFRNPISPSGQQWTLITSKGNCRFLLYKSSSFFWAIRHYGEVLM